MTVQRLDDAYIKALERADLQGADVIRFLYADHGGIIRGKASSRGRLAERLRTGIGHTVGMMAMSMLDSLQPVAGMGPVGEVRLVPDPATFTMLPYAPAAAARCADLVRLDGEPWEACARNFLKQAIADLAGDGYEVSAAFEPEFTLGRRVSDPEGGPDRLGPTGGRQPCVLPRDRTGRRFPAQPVGVAGAQADPRPDRQRLPPASFAVVG